MIGWLNPLALSALSLVAIPIVIHLLRTSRAEVFIGHGPSGVHSSLP